jgi:ABC-type dipeptide/oligopeptide/nickel transport system permease component
MRMWLYIVRRLILLVPIIIGVMTITFALVSALPITDRLTAVYGDPSLKAPWIYNPTLTPGQGPCPGPPNTASCSNPVYNRDVAMLGLNQPIPVQWGIYIYNSFTFNWGTVSNHSSAGLLLVAIHGLPVIQVLAWYLPYTIELAILSLLIIMVVAIPLGNLAAVNRNRPVDQAARIMSFSGYALPGFLLASLVLAGFLIGIGSSAGYVVHTPWCPSGELLYQELTGSWPDTTCFGGIGGTVGYPGWIHGGGIYTTPTGFPTVDALIHGYYWLAVDTVLRMVLPALVIAFGTIAVLLRFVRNSMLEVMNLDFVRTARAEGIPEKTVVRRHAGRNSLNVTITVMGLLFAFFIGGFPIIEDVFNLNGVGRILAYSVQNTVGPIDFGLVFGTTLLFTFIVVFANIIVDVLYAYLDPRVRLG